jgi:hypothetical protein
MDSLIFKESLQGVFWGAYFKVIYKFSMQDFNLFIFKSHWDDLRRKLWSARAIRIVFG